MNVMNILMGSVGAFTAGFLILNFLMSWQKDNIEKPTNILNALTEELKIIYSWAQPYDTEISVDDAKKMKRFVEFWNPSRVIFKFDYNTVQNILQSFLLLKLKPSLIESCIRLRQSIDNFYQYYEEYRRFALSNHHLYMKMIREISRNENIFSKYKEESDEINYINQIFDYNYHLHFGLIADHKKDGLHKNFIEMSEQISLFKISTPRWLKPVKVMSYIFMILGVLILIWFVYNIVIKIINLF